MSLCSDVGIWRPRRETLQVTAWYRRPYGRARVRVQDYQTGYESYPCIYGQRKQPPPNTFIWKIKTSLPISMKSLIYCKYIHIYIYIWLDNSPKSGYIGERILPTLTKACVDPWYSSGGSTDSWHSGVNAPQNLQLVTSETPVRRSSRDHQTAGGHSRQFHLYCNACYTRERQPSPCLSCKNVTWLLLRARP